MQRLYLIRQATRLARWALHMASGRVMGGSEHRPPRRDRGPDASGEQASALAVASLVLGIVCWFALPLIGSILGAILGYVELGRIERGESPAAGRSIAKFGMWLSILNVIVSVLAGCATFILVFVVGVSFAAIWATLLGLVGAG